MRCCIRNHQGEKDHISELMCEWYFLGNVRIAWTRCTIYSGHCSGYMTKLERLGSLQNLSKRTICKDRGLPPHVVQNVDDGKRESGKKGSECSPRSTRMSTSFRARATPLPIAALGSPPATVPLRWQIPLIIKVGKLQNYINDTVKMLLLT